MLRTLFKWLGHQTPEAEPHTVALPAGLRPEVFCPSGQTKPFSGYVIEIDWSSQYRNALKRTEDVYTGEPVNPFRGEYSDYLNHLEALGHPRYMVHFDTPEL